MSKKRIFLYLLAIVILSCALRSPSLLVGFVNIDENEYALAGKIITQGGVPYKDFLIYQPPLIYYLYALTIKLIPEVELGTSMWWVHVLMMLLVAANCVMIYLTGKRAFGQVNAALFASLFYAVFSTTFLPQDMLAANIELVMVFPMTVAVYFFFGHQFFLSGLFLGLGILSKYQGGILLPVVALYHFKKEGWKSLKGIAGLLLGILVIVALWLFYLHQNGALFYAKDCFEYILAYAKGPPQSDWLYVSFKFLLRTALIALSGFGLWYFAIRGMSKITWGDPACLFLLWALFGLFAVLAGGRMYFHYYIILYPALALLAGRRVSKFLDRLKQLPFEKAAWRLTMFFILIFVPVTGFTAYATYKPFRPKHKDYWIYVVDYVRDRTQPDDPILVWGYCPQIYTGSNRSPATRFTTSDYLTGRSPKTAGLEYDPKTLNPPSVWKKLVRDFGTPSEVIDYDTSDNIFPGGWDLFMQDLAKNPPKLIVDTAPSNYRLYGRYPMNKFPLLENYVKKNYIFEATIRGMDIYRLKKPKS